MENLHIIAHDIGFHGPFLMILLTVSQIWNRVPYLLLYIIGYFINKQLNETLKLIFKSPRPEPMDMLKQQQHDLFGWFHRWMSGSMDQDKIYIPHAHIYGMPSGHAQSAGYTLAFFYMIFSKVILESRKISVVLGVWITLIVIDCVVLWQRWEYKAHTVAQLAMGNFVGALFASVLVSFFKKYWILEPTVPVKPPLDIGTYGSSKTSLEYWNLRFQ
jgi:membrane-associated phospholipid phosphatase